MNTPRRAPADGRRLAGGLRLPLTFLCIALAVVVAACGGDVVSAGDTPGFSNEEGPAAEDDRFELVRPDEDGSATTLVTPPTLSVPGREPEPVESTTTTPTTSTPRIPQEPVQAGDVRSFCGFSDYLFSLVSVFTNPEVDIEAAIAEAPQTIEAYRRLSPPDLRADVALVSDTVLGLVDELEAAGFDVSEPAFRRKMAGLVTRQPEYKPFLDAYDRISFSEAVTCGG